MRFRYLIAIIVVGSACGDKEAKEPEPTQINNPGGGNKPKDTAYSTPQCTTNGYLKVDSDNTMWLSDQNMTTFKNVNYMHYLYYDLSSDYMDVYVKSQADVSKDFEIIPYDPNLEFTNYHQAMVRVYLDWWGGGGGAYFNSQSGTIHFSNSGNLSFCNAKFLDTKNNKTVSMDYH